jgi:hypothetical protein
MGWRFSAFSIKIKHSNENQRIRSTTSHIFRSRECAGLEDFALTFHLLGSLINQNCAKLALEGICA